MARLVLLATALALAGAAATRADPPPAATDTTADTTPATTTPATTTTAAVTTAPAATTTAAATTTEPGATTTAAATIAPAAPAPAAATLAVAYSPRSGCPPVGAVGLLLPHRRPVVLAPQRQLTAAAVAYPADGSVMTASALSLDSTCSDAHPTGGVAQVRGVSLFGGAVTARSATLELSGGGAAVSGLAVAGRPVSLSAGPIRIGNWGYVMAPDPTAASRSAFEIELSSEHAGLPAGTLVFVPYAQIQVAPAPSQAAPPAATTTEGAAAVPAATPTTPHAKAAGKRAAAKHRRHRRHKPGRRPLKVTPPLEAGPYVFPVGGNASFGDSYGGLRTDVAGGWHHGDDIFAPLGTPVVAVADGTLNRVGWERLGGWRLWVRDRAGDEFYYAHLSGYSPLALARGTVRRGEVIGFVGNTGDAFTTMAHLHFEIHPRSLLHLQYDGAVDPTTYLASWTRPGKLHAPRPVHPRLPKAALPRHEAAINFRELLAARGLTRRTAAESSPLPPVRGVRPLQMEGPHMTPSASAVSASAAGSGSSTATVIWAAIAGVVAAGLLALVGWRRWSTIKQLISR